MKNHKLFYSFMALFLLSLGLFSFDKYQKAKTAMEIFNSIMNDVVYQTSWSGKDTDADFTDKSAMFKKTNAEGQVKYYNPASLCENSPAYFYYDIANTVSSFDKHEGYRAEFKANFKSAFGKDLMLPALKMKAKNYDKSAQLFNQFSGLALQAAFDKLYKKPEATFEGVAMQKIYDNALQSEFRAMANVVTEVNKKKAAFLKEAAAYKTKALTDAKFDGQDFSEKASERLLGKDDGTAECIGYYKSRVVGIMLRRQVDGSLPVLLNCMNTMLKDYDPEFWANLK